MHLKIAWDHVMWGCMELWIIWESFFPVRIFECWLEFLSVDDMLQHTLIYILKWAIWSYPSSDSPYAVEFCGLQKLFEKLMSFTLCWKCYQLKSNVHEAFETFLLSSKFWWQILHKKPICCMMSLWTELFWGFRLCDEATSALDSTTEAEILNALRTLANNRTSIFIAHRLTTAMQCDEVRNTFNGLGTCLSVCYQIIFS